MKNFKQFFAGILLVMLISCGSSIKKKDSLTVIPMDLNNVNKAPDTKHDWT